jgi:hypothetical protein
MLKELYFYKTYMKKITLVQGISILLWIILLSFIYVLFQESKNIETQEEKIEVQNTIEQTQEETEEINQFELKPNTKDIKEMNFIELSNSLYMKDGWNNLKEKIQILSQSGSSNENKAKASYLESFLWDYKQAIANRDTLCEQETNDSYCKKTPLDITSYRPEDTKWNILDGVQISLPWEETKNLKWKNILNVYNKFVHRIKVSKKWYLDFYEKIVLDNTQNVKNSINPKLVQADKNIEISNNEDTQHKTDNFEYQISANTFVDTLWDTVNGKIDVFFFDIHAEDGDINALNLDSFDEDGSYIGNSMVTHWMPLIKAYKWEKELKINIPIIGKGKILEPGKSEWIDLWEVPKNEWLTKETLDQYNIPPFWYLDQNAWVWKSSEMKILDTKWNYEFKLF